MKVLLIAFYVLVSTACGASGPAKSPQAPIGDGVYAEVYQFILQALREQRPRSALAVRHLRTQELAHRNDPAWKSHAATISEGEVSALLKMICQAVPSCLAITLYDEVGVGFASSGVKNDLNFPDRDADLGLGILRAELQKMLPTFTYQRDAEQYVEVIRAIFVTQVGARQVGYVDVQKRHPKDRVLGLVSFLLKQEQKRS